MSITVLSLENTEQKVKISAFHSVKSHGDKCSMEELSIVGHGNLGGRGF